MGVSEEIKISATMKALRTLFAQLRSMSPATAFTSEDVIDCLSLGVAAMIESGGELGFGRADATPSDEDFQKRVEKYVGSLRAYREAHRDSFISAVLPVSSRDGATR